MRLATMMDRLKPHVEQAVLRGDFLISTNRLSDVWIGELKGEEARTLVRDLLTGFWTRYLEKDENNYLLVNIEQFEETSETTVSTGIVAKKVVDIINNPRLYFEKVFVDPNSFEVSIEKDPKDSEMMIFIEPSVPHDLLVATCKHLQMLGYPIKGVITPVERNYNNETAIRNDLHIELIPFIIYEGQQDKLYTIMEINEEPYVKYHKYFSS